jgi:hypothetical protein
MPSLLWFDASTTNLFRGAFELLDDRVASVPLFIREAYKVLLVHGNLLVPKRFPFYSPYRQPQFLAVKVH